MLEGVKEHMEYFESLRDPRCFDALFEKCVKKLGDCVSELENALSENPKRGPMPKTFWPTTRYQAVHCELSWLFHVSSVLRTLSDVLITSGFFDVSYAFNTWIQCTRCISRIDYVQYMHLIYSTHFLGGICLFCRLVPVEPHPHADYRDPANARRENYVGPA